LSQIHSKEHLYLHFPLFDKNFQVDFVVEEKMYHFRTSAQYKLTMGGCMVRWTNLGVMQSIFLPPKCDSSYYIVLYIMELLNGTHFENLDFNIYVMKLIGMQNI
jgi:hypothetical protein